MGKPGCLGRNTRKTYQLVLYMLAGQIVTTLLISSFLMVVSGRIAACSALLGGLIFILPSLYQARQVLNKDRPGSVSSTLRDLYKSEIWKMALTMAGFGVAFVLVKPIEPFSLFGVFILMQLSAWLTPLIQNHTLFKN